MNPISQGNEQKVGQVVMRRLVPKTQHERMYSDGDRELRLLKFLAGATQEQISARDVRRNPIWEVHLSPLRHNLLKWFPFDSAGHLLDIGAGCGALTGLFTSRLAQVTALEFSPQRAHIIAYRHQNAANLEVLVGGLQDLDTQRRFRYINITGVLEYAGTFFGGHEPHLSFLERAASFLNPEGELILAIENKLGLKYLTGAPEDHTGLVFESIYDYPRTRSAKTFSKNELSALLAQAGLPSQDWYYPFPDYKFPQSVLSDDAEPDASDRIWDLCPVQPLGTARREVIKERLLGKTLASAGLFPQFANSFLVVARKSPVNSEKRKCLRFWASSPNRKAEFALDSSIYRQRGETHFAKTPSGSEAQSFIPVMQNREGAAEAFFNGKVSVLRGTQRGGCLEYPLLRHPSLQKVIGEQLRRGDSQAALPLLERYVSLLRSLPLQTCVPVEFLRFVGWRKEQSAEPLLCFSAGPIDLIPGNLLVNGASYWAIDHEWFYQFPVPFELVVYRGLGSLVSNLQDEIRANALLSPITLFSGHGRNREYIPVAWVAILRGLKLPLDTVQSWNSAFQQRVLLRSPAYGLRLDANSPGSNQSDSFADRALESAAWHWRNWQHRAGKVTSKLRLVLQDLRGKLRQPN